MSVSAPARPSPAGPAPARDGSTPNAFERDLNYRDEIRARADRVRWVVIPARRYFMIDGTAAPGDVGFRDAIATLYPVAYTLHFALKKRGVDAPIGALEGLYWIGQPGPITAAHFGVGPDLRSRWSWRLMLPVSDEATAEECRAAIAAARAKQHPPLIGQLRCQSWDEGPAAQVMHIGPYDAEAPTIDRLHAAIADAGLRAHGCHHEIYVGDPNRSAPEKLKTLIRQPVQVPADVPVGMAG